MGSPMFRDDQSLIDAVLDFCRSRLSLDPVPLDNSGGPAAPLEAALSGLLTSTGTAPETVLETYRDVLAPAVISVDSIRYLAFIPNAPTKASRLFDMIVSASSLGGSFWLESSGAVAAEDQALALIAQMAGFPAGSGGVFVSGGSAGNLSGLVVARDDARRKHPELTRMRVAMSDQAHASVGKAVHVIGLESLVVPTTDYRLDADALEAALAADPHADDVIAVVATAGTTNAGIIDDLSGIGELARRRGIWFHVDGAYGAGSIFSPTVRPRLRGLELADSFVVDPHKWLFAPLDCAALIYRDPHLAKAVHTQDAGYLDVAHTNAPEESNPSDLAYHLTRRARGMPLWFSLAVHGTDLYAEAIDAGVALASWSAEEIRSRPELDLIRDPELSVVVFRRRGWSDADYQAWSRKLIADQVAFVMPTVWDGETVARLAFLHPDTTHEIVLEVLDSMR
jgi:aromatic-L-amino-acid/L-tryptophan decarboxylase